MLFIPKTGQKSHMVKSHARRKTRTDLQLVQSEHISVHSWHITNWWMVKLQIYNWRPILYKKETLGSVAPCQYEHLTNKSPTGNANTGTSFQLRFLIVHIKLLLEIFYIEMEYSQKENLHHLFTHKCSFSNDPPCQFLRA
jgi:hypothetical protein